MPRKIRGDKIRKITDKKLFDGIKVGDVMHCIGGYLTSWTCTLFPLLATILSIMFIIYEMDEDWCISDEAYKDIRMFLTGMFIFVLYLFSQYVVR